MIQKKNSEQELTGMIISEKDFLGRRLSQLLMNDPRFDNIPLILETPEESLWEAEIKKLYSLIK